MPLIILTVLTSFHGLTMLGAQLKFEKHQTSNEYNVNLALSEIWNEVVQSDSSHLVGVCVCACVHVYANVTLVQHFC